MSEAAKWHVWGNEHCSEWFYCPSCDQSFHVNFQRRRFYIHHDANKRLCECCYRDRFPLKPFETVICLHCIAQERQNCINEIQADIQLPLLQPLVQLVIGYAFDRDKWLRFCPEFYLASS